MSNLSNKIYLSVTLSCRYSTMQYAVLSFLSMESLVPYYKWNLYQITSALGCLNWKKSPKFEVQLLSPLSMIHISLFLFWGIFCKVKKDKTGLRYWKPTFWDSRENVHGQLFHCYLGKDVLNRGWEWCINLSTFD